MKGIILAGGNGTRLNPITIPTIKQLLPIYDKPMIYYPLSVLMQAGVDDILIISTPKDINRFKDLLKDGSQIGIKIQYEIQNEPKGLVDAFIIGEKFINNEEVWLILGDNIIYGANLTSLLRKVPENNNGATIFGYHVKDAKRFGVIEFDITGKVISIEEKPKIPKSNYAAIGLYYYDKNVSKFAKEIIPSNRGELEITSLNNLYLNKNKLNTRIMNRGFTWFDAGTYNSMLEASNFVKVIEDNQGLKIGCIEEIAYKRKLISKDQLIELSNKLLKTNYGNYLKDISNENILILPDHARYNF